MSPRFTNLVPMVRRYVIPVLAWVLAACTQASSGSDATADSETRDGGVGTSGGPGAGAAGAGAGMPGKDGGMAQPDGSVIGSLDCSRLLACVGACTNDACIHDCQANATSTANTLLARIAECFTANNCTDQACGAQYCREPIAACVGTTPPSGARDGGSDTAPPPRSSDAGPGTTQRGTFPDSLMGTNGSSPQFEIDTSGVRHYAYETINADDLQHYPIRYGECADNCTLRSNWTFLSIGDRGLFGTFANLGIDRQGRPRLMWDSKLLIDDTPTLFFASCDAHCTDPSNWTSGPIATLPSGSSGTRSGRRLGFDGSGRIHFIYSVASPQGDEMFYATCPANCMAPSSWTHVSLGLADHAGSLAVSATGQVRIGFSAMATTPLAVLRSCEDHCELFANWKETALFEGAGDLVALRIDPQGHPRLLFFLGQLPVSDPNSRKFGYASCNDNCTDPAGWTAAVLGELLDGSDGLDFDLDPEGKPIVVYKKNLGALMMLRCTTNCDAPAAATWTTREIESAGAIEIAPVSPPNCFLPQWVVGEQAAAAFHPLTGELEIASRVRSIASCARGQILDGASIPRFTRGY